jgi:hypothetical protein
MLKALKQKFFDTKIYNKETPFLYPVTSVANINYCIV